LDFDKLSDDEVVDSLSEVINQLKKREIIDTKNVTGDLGQFLAIRHYCNTPSLPNLLKAGTGTKGIDAISRKGERYTIKTTTRKTTGSFWDLNPPNSKKKDKQVFEYVIIVLLDDNYTVKKIIELNWEQFLKLKRWHAYMKTWYLSVTRELVQQGKIVFP